MVVNQYDASCRSAENGLLRKFTAFAHLVSYWREENEINEPKSFEKSGKYKTQSFAGGKQLHSTTTTEKYEVEVTIGVGKSSDWWSIYVASFLGFCASLQLALFGSSMWPYLKTIDSTATEQFFGYAVSAFSIGEMVGSSLAGYFSNRFRRVSPILYVGTVLLIIGNIIYSFAEWFLPGKAKFVVLISHTMTGFGYSTNSLLQAYVSMASVPNDRPRAIAFVTGGMALGAVTGPAFQLLLIPIGYPGWDFNLFGILQWRINMYTAPACLACAMNAIGAISVYLLFHENYAGILHEEKIQSRLVTSLSNVIFSWDNSKVVQVEATAQIAMHILALLTYISYIAFRLDKFVSLRLSTILSLGGLIVFHILTYSYPFLPGHLNIFNSSDDRNTFQGCNIDQFSWCDKVKPINPVLFYCCYIIAIGLAFPNISVTLHTLFSKIIGPRRQGTHQGLLETLGSSARMIDPVVVTSLYTYFGPPMVWNANIGVLTITFLFWVIFYRRMVPLSLQIEPLPEYHKIKRMDMEQIKGYGAIENDDVPSK